MVSWKSVIIAVIIVFVFFVFTGNFLSEQCVDLDGCKQCWKPVTTTVISDLCPTDNEVTPGASVRSCVATSEQQQYNAYIDAALCACEKAQINEYSNEELNTKIIDSVFVFSGYRYNTAQEFCDQPGAVAVKVTYG